MLKDLFGGLPAVLILYGATILMKAIGMMSTHPPGIQSPNERIVIAKLSKYPMCSN